MNWKVLFANVGRLLIGLGLTMLIPTAFAAWHFSVQSVPFLESSLLTAAAGIVLRLLSGRSAAFLNHRTAFAIVSVSWVLCCLFGALPFYLGGTIPHLTDAIFEACSGFSGTGASVLVDVEAVDRAILLWRSLIQWIGGMGMVLLFVAVLPVLGAGGVHLFRAETAGPTKDKITPRVQESALRVWLLYTSFTAACAALLVFSGVNLFDAINHAMCALASGSFSTRNAGVAAFHSSAVDFILGSFMLLGAINYNLHYRIWIQRDFSAFFDTELKTFLGLTAGAVALISLINWNPLYYADFGTALQSAYFTVTSMASTTGVRHYDYLQWPATTHLILIMLMVMGGMSGSSSGGIKCIRVVVAAKVILRDIKQLIHPSAILGVRINGRIIRPELTSSIAAFICLYSISLLALSWVVLTEGLDLVTAVTATISCLSGLGPAFGTLGPMDDYSALADSSKWALSLAMILGRLEFLTILVMFSPEYWRK